jgi:hypothetical protein
MTRQLFGTTLVSAALLLGAAAFSVSQAASLNVGNAVSATVGGGNGNVASGHVGAAGNDVDVSIGTGNGPLADVDSRGNPLDGGSQTTGVVNLGALFQGIDLDGGTNDPGTGDTGDVSNGGGGGGITLTADDRQLLKNRCRSGLGQPERFANDIVSVCRLIARM